MSYRSSTEGGYGIGGSTDHVDASHADRIDISDAELLFRGHFARSGPDLILTGQDGHRLVVIGYFTTEKHPDLVAPNGAHLTGDLVDLLAGSPTPGQYAQAKTTLPPEAIGKVEKVVGHVTLIHNGVAGPLHVGDPVYKTDIVETAANSSCGIAFPDGTALDLVNNTRMALNEYNYEANSASNGAIFSLVEGTFAFVAGQVAHTGEGLKINTPVATMGVRGTVGLFRTEPTVINSNLGHVWSVFLHEDIDGSHHLGRIALIDQDPTSPTFGQTFYLLDSSDYIAYLEPQGGGQPPHVRLEPNTNAKAFENRHFFDDLGKIIESYKNADPQSPSTPGSGDNPSDLFQQQLFQDDGGKPLFNFGKLNGSGDSENTFSSSLPLIPVMGGLLPNTNITNTNITNTNITTSNEPTPPASTIFIWNGTGAWPTALANWNSGAAPNSSVDSVIIQSGTATFDLPNTTVSFLTIDPGSTLDIVGGSLTVLNGVTDNGTISVAGDPPALTINGPVTIGSSGSFTATGSGDEIEFANGSVDSQGTITAQNLGEVLFQSEMVTNEFGARIVTDNGFITFAGGGVKNGGLIDAKDQGIITFESISGNPIDVTNSAGASIEAKDWAQIEFVGTNGGGQVVNQGGTIKATHHGIVTFDDIAVTNESDGLIEAKDGGTVVFKDVAGDKNGGFFNSGTVAAIGCGSEVDFYHTDITGGTLKADGGTIFVSCDSSLLGTVSVLISGGGLANLADTVSDAAVTVTFSGAGTLELADSLGGAFGGTITGFGPGDAIILDDLTFAKGEYAIWCNGILTIYECGKIEETIKISGDYSAHSFAVINDNGKTEVVLADNEWIGPSPEDRTGTWTTASNWGDDLVPNSALNAIVDLPGKYTITTSGDQAANSLAITDTHATLRGSGTLALGSFENHGTIKADCDDNLVIQIAGPSTNDGAIKAVDGVLTLSAGTDDKGVQLFNFGRFAAIDGGDISIQGIALTNEITNNDGTFTYGRIKSVGEGSEITFADGAPLFNYGRVDALVGIMEAERHGTIRIGHSFLKNADTIEAVGLCSALILSCDLIDNTGTVLAKDAGAVEVFDSKFLNAGGEVEAKGCDSIITFCHDGIANKHGAEITATDFGTIIFDDDKIANKHDSTIDASLGGLIKIDYSEIVDKDHSAIKAGDGGSIALADDWITNTGASTIEANGHYSAVNLQHSFVMNDGGTLAAIGCDAVVNLSDTTIAGGTLETRHGGTIEVVAMRGYDTNMSVFDGSNGHAVTIDGYVLVDAGANLELKGTIYNEGVIEVDGKQTDLVIDGTVTLDDHGTVMLDNANHPADQIVGGHGDGNTLDNVNNTIEGARNIGTGDRDLRLVNEKSGMIDANACEQTLTLDTGHNQISNEGTLAASHGGTLDVESAVDNTSDSIKVSDGGFADFEKSVTGGTATIHGGTLESDAASINVTFDNITIDNFDFSNLEKASDGHGGTIIFDPPAASSTSPSVSIGGAGNDTFLFHPGEGSQTVNNFDPQHDTVELDHFANIHNVEELAAAITPDMHGNAVLELGHDDNIAIPGVSATFLQQHLQNLVHLHA